MEGTGEGKRFCVFCLSDENLSGEHVWPEWVRKHLPLRADQRFPHVWTQAGEVVRERTNMPLASITIRRVCEPCNTGWMARIEEAAEPVLADLIKGNPRTLDQEAMTIAATWGYLKTLVVDLAMNGKQTLVTPVVHAWFRQFQRPPDSALVALACYGGVRHALYSMSGRNPFNIPADTGGSYTVHMYTMILGVGHLVVKVAGHHLPIPVNLDPAAGDRKFASRIWPQPDGAVRWPPSSMLDDTSLKEFARRF